MVTTISYANQSPSQVLDLYRPENPKDKNPLLILVYGGAFIFGNQKMPIFQPVIAKVLSLGYVVASLDYRKSNEAIFPAALADVKAAVRFLKAHADEFAIDSDNITIWGESAGAYLSVMTALTAEVKALDGDLSVALEESSAVHKLVSFYAPVDFYNLKSDYRSFGNLEKGDGHFEALFLGVEDIYQAEEACTASYWETYRDQLPADFSLKAIVEVGGEGDDKVPYLQSQHLAEKLEKLDGVTLSYKQIKEAKHEDPLFYTEENLSEIFEKLEV